MAARLSTTEQLKKLRSENTSLKAEVKRLQRTQNSQKTTKKSRNIGEWFRKAAVVLLISIAVVTLGVGNIFFWTGNTLVKQDRFTASVQPVIQDPEVQQAMALYVTNNLFAQVDVQAFTEQVLPPRADFLAPQLTSQIKTQTQNTLQSVLARPAFQDRWNTAIANQHQRLIGFVTKYEGDGSISLNDIYNQLSSRLSDTKLSFLANKTLPANIGNVNVVTASWLPEAHNVVTNINTWRFLAVTLMVLTLVGAMWLSRYRRRTLYVFCWASAGMMVATLIARRIAIETITGRADSQYQAGVRNALQIVLHPLAVQTITILCALLIIGIIAWVSGPSRYASAIKKQVALLFSGKLHRRLFSQENRITRFFYEHKRTIQWFIVAFLALLMLLARLTIRSLLVYLGILLLLVLIVELIGGQVQANSTIRRRKSA